MWKQVAAGLIASGVYLLDGMDEGYSSNILHQKEIHGFPFEIDDVALSWIASAMLISMPMGCIFSGPLTYTFGRKKILLAMCLLSFLGWFLMLEAQSIFVLCVGRYLTGFSVGLEIASMMYVSEIASNPAYRAFLLSLGAPMVGLGTTISFILGSYLSERIYCISICLISLLFLGLTCVIPESPVWLTLNDNHKAAAKSLEWLQRSNDDIEENIKEDNPVKFSKNIDSLPLLTKIKITKAWKPFLNLSIFFVLQNLTGFPVLVFYAANVYQSMDVPLDFSMCAIILVIIQTLSYCFLSTFVNKLDRRTWCRISAIGLFICFTIISVYELLFYGMDSKPFYWLPLMSFWIGSVFGSIGMYTIPWLQIGEVFPESVKDFMGSYQLLVAFVLQFLFIKVYPLMEPVIEMYGLFTIMSGASLASIFYSQFMMIETRGKSLEEIENMWL